MKTTSKLSLCIALFSLGLAGCAKDEAPAPTVPTTTPTTADASGESILRANERLLPNQFLQSANGQYQLLMQGDGNLVIYRLSDRSGRWSTRTAGNPGAYCVMQADANFVVYSATGRPLYASGARTGPRTDHYLWLTNNGQLLLPIPSRGVVFGISI